MVGLKEAAIPTAVQLGGRFAIVTFSPAVTPWYLASVTALGLSARWLGEITPGDRAVQVNGVAQIRRAASRDLAQDLAAEVPAILVDPNTAATRQSDALAWLSQTLHRTCTRLGAPHCSASVARDAKIGQGGLAGAIVGHGSVTLSFGHFSRPVRGRIPPLRPVLRCRDFGVIHFARAG